MNDDPPTGCVVLAILAWLALAVGSVAILLHFVSKYW